MTAPKLSEARRDPCIARHGCRSPVACGGFGYCRERNFSDERTTEATIAAHRREAASRQALKETRR